MSDGQFWLTVEQFGRLEPHLPRNTRGKPRMDDRRVRSYPTRWCRRWTPTEALNRVGVNEAADGLAQEVADLGSWSGERKGAQGLLLHGLPHAE